MGDTRFEAPYARVRDARDPSSELRALDDDDVIAAIAGASRARDPYLANVLATEALNRTHIRSALIDTAREGMLTVDANLRVSFINRAASRMLGLRNEAALRRAIDDVLTCHDSRGEPVAWDDHPVVVALHGGKISDAVEGRIVRADGTSFAASWTAAPLRTSEEIVGGVFVFRDITRRHASDVSMRESERMLRNVVRGAPVIIFALGADGRFTLAEGRGLEEIGGRPDQIVGLSAFALDEYGLEIGKAAERALAGEQVETVIEAAGYTFQTRWAPVRSAAGDVVGAVGVATDITRALHAEASTRRALALLETTIESTMDGILVVDLDRTILRYNENYLRIWGLSKDVLRLKDHLLVLEASRDAFEDPDATLRRAREMYAHPEREETSEVALVDGRICEWATRPHRMDGKIVGRVWTARDVTDVRRTARRLAESEQIYRAFLEQTMDAVALVDLQGVITQVNGSYCRMLGYEPKELVGRRARDLLAPEGREEGVAAARRDLAGEPTLHEATLVHKSGQRVRVRGTARPIVVDGKVVGTFGIVRELLE